MNTHVPHSRTAASRTEASRPGRAGRRLRRMAGLVVAALAGLLSLSAPAFATIPADGFGPSGAAVPVTTPTVQVISTGVATWQVTLVAIGAALLGAAVVLLVTRLHPARRNQARRMAPSPVA